jgi:CRISPR-associated protein Cas1
MLTSNCSFLGDLQEPFRWIADVAVMQAFESRVLDLPDFYFTGDDYRYRFEPEAKRRFLDFLRERFNSGVTYKGRSLKWDTVIQEKANELGRYLIGRSRGLDLSGPATVLERTDNRTMREVILSLRQSEARERGIGKSTFHYLRRRAMCNEPFTIHGHTMMKLKPSRTHLLSLIKGRS